MVLWYRATTTATTLDSEDYTVNCSGTFTATLPTAVLITGTVYNVKNTGAGTITVDWNSTQTIDGSLTQSLAQRDNLTIQSDWANWIIL
jgi:hypothetical protein